MIVIVIDASTVINVVTPQASSSPMIPPKRAKNCRLDQKLKQDLPPRRADRFSQSNFKCSFGDAHQHDVHHHDAADNQRDQRDRNNDHGDACR